MIGRKEQLQNILDEIESIRSGRSSRNVLFITGEAGIGKTTLLNAVRNAVQRLPATTRPTIAFAECSTPLAGQNIGEMEALVPWVTLMSWLLEHTAQETVEKKKSRFDFGKFFIDTAPSWVTMIPVLGPSVGAALEIAGAGYDQMYLQKKLQEKDRNGNSFTQQQIFQQYIDFLSRLAEQTPLVLIIDDFHWADASSTNLLFAAARALLGKPILFIIAYRPDDVASSNEGKGHPISHIRNELERYSLSKDIGMPQLTAIDMNALLHSRYPHYAGSEELQSWLLKNCGGNALFITQYLNMLEEEGLLRKQDGVFLGKIEDLRVPQSASAVMQERLRRLSEEDRQLLRYASAEGDIFTADVLAHILNTPPLKVLQQLRNLEDTHRLVRSLGKLRMYTKETPAFQFSSPLFQKALYDSLSPAERELLHETILQVLKAEWYAGRDSGGEYTIGFAARFAAHAEALQQFSFAAEVLLDTAARQTRQHTEEEALRNIDTALTLLSKAEPQNDEERTVLQKRKAEAFLLAAHIRAVREQKEEARIQMRQAMEVLSITSLLPDYDCDIYISYNPADAYDDWVDEFITRLRSELEATVKDSVSIYVDRHDDRHPHTSYGLIGILRPLLFMPILSQTYCTTEGFAWQKEFLPFLRQAEKEELGLNLRLLGGTLSSRVLPIRIHNLDTADIRLLSTELQGLLRSVDFVYEAGGANRPLRLRDDEFARGFDPLYRNQINKTANTVKELLSAARFPSRHNEPAEQTVPASIAASAPEPHTIFLSWASADMKARRDELALILQKAGLTVLPSVDCPTDDEEFQYRVSEDLQRSVCSLHLLGNQFGRRLEADEQTSLSMYQYHEARARVEQDSSFMQYIWYNPGSLAEDSAEQRKFLNEIRNGLVKNQVFTNVSSPMMLVEDIRSILHSSVQDSALSKETDIFFILNHQDESEASSITDLLSMDIPLEVLTIEAGREEEYRQMTVQQIPKSELAVVYFKYSADWAIAFIKQVWKAVGGASSTTHIMLVGEDEPPTNRLRTFKAPKVISAIVPKNAVADEIKKVFEKVKTG